MSKAKTVTIGGKEVPLTKNGMPNQVYLSKEAKAVVAQWTAKRKGEKTAMETKELTDLLAKLG